MSKREFPQSFKDQVIEEINICRTRGHNRMAVTIGLEEEFVKQYLKEQGIPCSFEEDKEQGVVILDFN